MPVVRNNSVSDTDVAAANGTNVRAARETSKSRDRRTAPLKSSKLAADVSGYEDAIREAEDSDDPDAYKYRVAVQMVNDQIGDEQTLGDQAYRDSIDATYAQLNPTVTGEEMRGEDDVLSGAVRGVRGAIDDLNYGIGSGIDWVWDNVVGNAAGGIVGLFGGDGEEARQNVSDWVTPETGSAISDILLDLGISAIPGVGIPLAVAKNAVQQSENIYEGITGVDDITGESIDAPQQLAKLGVGLGSTALSATPGIGKARNAKSIADDAADAVESYGRIAAEADDMSDVASRLASGSFDDAAEAATRIGSDDISDLARRAGNERNASRVGAMGSRGSNRVSDRTAAAIDDVVEDAARSSEVAHGLLDQATVAARADTPRAAIDEIVQGVRNYGPNFRRNMSAARDSLRSAASNVVDAHPLRAVGDVVGSVRNAKNAVVPQPSQISIMSSMPAAEVAEETAKKAGGKLGDTAREVARVITGNAPSMVANFATPQLASMATTYAENGGSLDDFLSNYGDRVGSEGPFPSIAMAILPGVLGANNLSRRLPGVGGRYTQFNVPDKAARAASALNYYTQYPQARQEEKQTPDEVAEYLRNAKERNDAQAR